MLAMLAETLVCRQDDPRVTRMTGKAGRTLALPRTLTGVQTVTYLPEVDSLLRGANLVALQVSTACFCIQVLSNCNIRWLIQGSLSRRDLWYEAALLKKLLYKSKNQHRSSKHFQYLSEVYISCVMHAQITM